MARVNLNEDDLYQKRQPVYAKAAPIDQSRAGPGPGPGLTQFAMDGGDQLEWGAAPSPDDWSFYQPPEPVAAPDMWRTPSPTTEPAVIGPRPPEFGQPVYQPPAPQPVYQQPAPYGTSPEGRIYSGPSGAGGFSRARWNELIGQYPGTVAGLDRLVREHPELGLQIVGGSRGDIQLPNGQMIDVILSAGEGGRGWTWDEGGGGGGGAAPGWWTSPSGGAGYTDQSTAALEAFLNQRIEQLRNPYEDPSRQAYERMLLEQATQLQQPYQDPVRQQYEQALLEQINRLQQPAYTGQELEILRTQALDPIERDRQAALQRGRENISARGFDPSSGIAMELLNQIGMGADRQRAEAQNQLAAAQIQEQRSREREAVGLRQTRSQVEATRVAEERARQERAQALLGTRGQIEAERQREAQAREQEAQALLSLLYDLPHRSLQDSLAVLGMGPSSGDLFNQMMGLYGIGQQGRQQGAQWYEALGSLLPFISRPTSGGNLTGR